MGTNRRYMCFLLGMIMLSTGDPIVGTQAISLKRSNPIGLTLQNLERNLLPSLDLYKSDDPLTHRLADVCRAGGAKTAEHAATVIYTAMYAMETIWGLNTTHMQSLVIAMQRHWPDHWVEMQGVAICLQSFGLSITAEMLAVTAYIAEISTAAIPPSPVERTERTERTVVERRLITTGKYGIPINKVNSVRIAVHKAMNLPTGMNLACSGTLVCMADGHVAQARTMDWTLAGLAIQHTTAYITYHNDTKQSHQTSTYSQIAMLYGIEGAHGGSNGAFTIQVNMRYSVDHYRRAPLDEIIEYCIADMRPVGSYGCPSFAPNGHFNRWALENINSFSDAVNFYSNATYIFPWYAIMSGAHEGQGVILGFGNDPAPAPSLYNVRYLNCSEKWYQTITNYDTLEASNLIEDFRWQSIQDKMDTFSRQDFATEVSTQAKLQEIVTMLPDRGRYCSGNQPEKLCYSGTVIPAPGGFSTYSFVNLRSRIKFSYATAHMCQGC